MSVRDALTTRVGALLRHPRLYSGRRYLCPCCGRTYRRFRPKAGRTGAQCPGCLSLERHRVLWLYLQRETDLRSRELDVLHFAPEPSLASLLSGLPNLRYRSGDLQPGAAMEVMDMTAIPAAAESFDLVLCNHVLEHVPDDLAAMRELHRVLRRGGAAITQHPVEWGRERTFEDPSITAPEDRLRAFGQEDHVRVYGPDFLDRWRAAGFEPELRRYRDELPPAEVERMRLDDGCRADAGRRYTGDDIVICRRRASPATTASAASPPARRPL